MKIDSKHKGKSLFFFLSDKWAFSIAFTILFFYIYYVLSISFLELKSIPIGFLNKKLDIIETFGPNGWQSFKIAYLITGLIGIFLSGFVIYRTLFENLIKHKKKDSTNEIGRDEVSLPEFPWNKNSLQLVIGIKHKKQLFLASTNPRSPELNFPSTPYPLLGFHG